LGAGERQQLKADIIALGGRSGDRMVPGLVPLLGGIVLIESGVATRRMTRPEPSYTRQPRIETPADPNEGRALPLIGPGRYDRHMANQTASARRSDKLYDVIIVGGGPAGLSAALALGRARKRVLLCDSGPRRNAAAEQIHNFVTRDGTPPNEFRKAGRRELVTYPNVQARDEVVGSISGARGSFQARLASETVEARRVLLCTGMVDELLPIEGFRELWGQAIFQCPYCHGWEVQDRRWGYLGRAADSSHLLPFSLMLRAWTRDVVAFTGGTFDVPGETRDALHAAGIRLETAPLARLVAQDGRFEGVELSNGTHVPRDVLFTHPPQRQVELVRALGVVLDGDGYVQVDAMKRETSVAGIYAAGDLTTRMQAAVTAAASGTQAAAAINGELTMELAANGEL
jgi:thioredoxin reductase